MPIACTNAKGTDKYLVYCCIFCCQASPCSVNSSNCGTTDQSNCIIMDALIKGANHKAIKEN